MFRIFSVVAALALFLGLQREAFGFSLYGATDTRWQTGEVAYDTWAGELGGPMNLGEEYRISSPVLTYGFDKTFLDYFGEDGVVALEQAMAILNGIPAATAMSDDLSEFPLAAKRMNLQAAALQAIDIKTYTISSILAHMGVGASPRWVWTIQDASQENPNAPPEIWEFSVVMRNFDPFTWAHSPYINEVLWTYQTAEVLQDVYDAVDIPVDPLLGSLRLPLSNVAGQGYTTGLLPGEYYTGLTRDDAAALKYLYSPRNLNAEILPVGATNTTGPVFSGGGGGTGSPWGPPTGTGGGGVGSPFSSPFIGLTNIFTNITFTNITGGAGVALIDGAVRAGVDKVTFQRMDAPFGIYTAVTNRWLDVFFTNFGPSIVMVQQPVERIITRPDILFGADNLPNVDGQDPAFFLHTVGWNNNAPLNTQTSPENPGPGTALTPFDLVFSNAGPHIYNLDTEPIGGADGTEGSGFYTVIWGSFDGSSRPPVLFPSSMSIQAAEARILGLSTTP